MVVYDANNDQFVKPLCCPHPGCEAQAQVLPDQSPELFLCPSCGRAYEVVKVPAGEGSGASTLWVSRRATTAFCTSTGQRLSSESVLDWAGAGGGASRAGALPDRRALLFGVPTRDVEWDLVRGWEQRLWGTAEQPRHDEIVTSVSAFRGVVVVASAQGTIGLFDPADGRPLLEHALSWPGVDIDDDAPARALRLPPAFLGTTMVVVTDRTALFRDLAPSLFGESRARRSLEGHGLFREVRPSTGCQWIGPALACAHTPRVVLVEGRVAGDRPSGRVRVFDLAGDEVFAVDAPDIARPPAFDADSGRVVWTSRLGHVTSFDPLTTRVDNSLPAEMLSLAPGERAHLLVAPDNAGVSELWLADDSHGSLRVWRVPLLRALAHDADWTWELVVEHKDTGSLRGMAVGAGSKERANLAGQYVVLATEKATFAVSRATKGSASDAVLQKPPIATPILTSVGFLSQDRFGVWLRALPPWGFKDGNPERGLLPDVREGRPALWDRTIAVFGRQVFFSQGGRVLEARLTPRVRTTTSAA